MNCDEYLPLISGHLDGVNSEIEERRLQEHLETCEACRVLLSQMEQNDALLQSAATPPADLTDRIMNAVRKEKRTAKKRWILRSPPPDLPPPHCLVWSLCIICRS